MLTRYESSQKSNRDVSCCNSAEITCGSMICYLAFALFILKTIDKDQPHVISGGILAPTKGYLPRKLWFKTFFYGFFI